jgi:tetratricopeptide (TPR) repeat protein
MRAIRSAVVTWVVCSGLLSGESAGAAETFYAGDAAVVQAAATPVQAGTNAVAMLPKGTRFNIEKVGDTGQFVLGTFRIGEKNVSGWVRTEDLVPSLPDHPPVARGPDGTMLDKMRQRYGQIIARYGTANDAQAPLYGFTIRQGMTVANTAQLAGQDTISSLDQYWGNAGWGFDPSVVREAGTQQLLAAIPAEVTLDSVLGAVGLALMESRPQHLAERYDQLAELRSALNVKRRQRDFTGALADAAAIVTLSEELYGAESWQSRDAAALVQTLTRIAALPADAQATLARQYRLPSLMLAGFRQMQYETVRVAAEQRATALAAHLGQDHPDVLASKAWALAMQRAYSAARLETAHITHLQAVRQKYGDGHPATARVINNLALLRHDRADFEGAERLLLFALSQRVQRGAAVDADVAWMLFNLARVFETAGRIPEALECARVSRAVIRELPAGERVAVTAELYDDFAPLSVAAAGDAPFYQRSGLGFRPYVTTFLGWGGIADFGLTGDGPTGSQGQFFDSLSEQRIQGQVNDANLPHQAYEFTARLHMRAGDLATAERFQRQAVEVGRQAYRSRPDVQWHLSYSLIELTRMLEAQGRREEAIPLYEEALTEIRPRWEAEYKQGAAAFRGGGGDYFAWSAYQQYMETLLARAANFTEMGRLEQAEAYYRHALETARAPYQFDQRASQAKLSHVPRAISELGDLLVRRGKLDEAEQLLSGLLQETFNNWAFDIWKEVHVFRTLSNLARVYASRPDADSQSRALAMEADGFEIITHNSQFARGQGASQQVLARARGLRATGRYAEAALLLERAIRSIDESRTDSGGDEISRARYFSELSRHDPHSAMAQLQVEAGAEFTDHFGVGEFGPRAALTSLEQGRGRALLDLLARSRVETDELLTRLQMLRNDPALDGRIAGLRSSADAAAARAAQLSTQIQDVQKRGAQARTPAAQLAAQVRPLETQLQTAQNEERSARQQLLDLARVALVESRPRPMTAEEVTSALADDERLIAYDVAADGVILLIAHPDGRVDGRRLVWGDGTPVDRRSLAVTLAQFVGRISHEGGDEPVPQAHGPDDLRAALVPADVLADLQSARQVLVVPHGPLHRLPLESLFPRDAGSSEVGGGLPPLVYGASATLLLDDRRSELVAETISDTLLVAVGDPAFGGGASAGAGTSASEADAAADRSRSLALFGELPPLPGTRAEVQAIEQRLAGAALGKVQTLLDTEATATNLFSAVDRPRFLHLATHGLAEGGLSAWESALALAKPAQPSASDIGFLRLSDLLDRWGGKLDGTELVVLSACRTARGEMEGSEGIVALTWGFLFAGADNVVASLWNVDDTATALLMVRFYDNLLGLFSEPRAIGTRSLPAGEALTPADALGEARTWLQTLNRAAAEEAVANLGVAGLEIPAGDRPFADPFYWSAFVLVGTAGQTP